MRPPLRYAKTVDGGNVAYTVVGDGYPLMDFSGGPACNAVVEWDTPNISPFYGRLASRLSFVRLEPRGGPNSSAPPAGRKYRDYLLDDIDAVADELGLGMFAAVAWGVYAEHLATYATRYPARMSHLVFGLPVTQKLNPSGAIAAGAEEASQRWGTDVWILHAQSFLGNADPKLIDAYAHLLRSTCEAPNFRAWTEKAEEHNREIDLAPFVSRIRQPTLVIANSRTPLASRDLAASIPGSQLSFWPRHPFAMTDPDESRTAADEVVDFICGPGRSSAASKAELLGNLTGREREILALIAAGHSNAEIGEALVLSAATASRHVANIYGKLGIHNRAQATAVYFGHAGEGADSKST